jgi:uncharacterized protein YndB with AHSA1/START domain
MNEPDDACIEREIVIDAPADVVWATITEPDQISAWFADRVELDLRPGGHGRFVFGDAEGDDAASVPMVVETVDRPSRFAFRWARPGDTSTETRDTMLVEFTLVAETPERTRLRVSETGIDETGWSADERARYVEDHRDGWVHHLDRLTAWLAKR